MTVTTIMAMDAADQPQADGSRPNPANASTTSEDAAGPAGGASPTTNGEPTRADIAPGQATAPPPATQLPIVRQRLRWQHAPRDEAPGLVLMWCLWLLGSWLIIRYHAGMSPLQMIGLGESAGPAVSATDLRWMIVAAVTGLSGLWPAVRLTQQPRGPRRPWFEAFVQPLVDWLGLMLVWQAVLWPVFALLPWPIEQVVWLDAAMVSWALLMGFLIGLGRAGGTGPARSAAMVGCVALLLAEPAARALWHKVAPGVTEAGPMVISPLQMLWELTAPPGYLTLTPWRSHVVALAAAAVIGWGGLVITLRMGKRRSGLS